MRCSYSSSESSSATKAAVRRSIAAWRARRTSTLAGWFSPCMCDLDPGPVEPELRQVRLVELRPAPSRAAPRVEEEARGDRRRALRTARTFVGDEAEAPALLDGSLFDVQNEAVHVTEHRMAGGLAAERANQERQRREL